MVDATVCDRRFPLRWRSSLVVFGYQPPLVRASVDVNGVSDFCMVSKPQQGTDRAHTITGEWQEKANGNRDRIGAFREWAGA